MRNRDNILLTTVDNPFDPFTQWRQWYNFDMKMGYDTCGLIARVANHSSLLTEEETFDCLDAAYKTILDFYEPIGLYRIAVEGKERQLGLSRS